jgi:DNA-binding SARP family transcriptional activator/predicted ATPase
MSHLAIFALGPLRIELDGEPIRTSRHKALALLVYLAAVPEILTREVLSSLLWPDYEQEKSYAYLRRALWELKSLLGEGWLEANREQISLNRQANIYLDVDEFTTHLTAFHQHNHTASTVFCQECLTHLQTATLLYRGDFLAGFSLRDSPSFEDWQFFQAGILRHEYASALQQLAILLYQQGAFLDAAMFTERWLALDNFNEEAYRLLMKIYNRSGKRHQAIRQYQECQRILQAELGVAPEPATRSLYASIISGMDTQENEISSDQLVIQREKLTGVNFLDRLLDGDFFTHGSSPTSNLPTPSTAFVGREQELSQISALLSDSSCWLLTLLGPGGIGKTRLAIEAGRINSANHNKGVFFIPLSMVETERSIAPTIASAMGLIFRQDGPPPEEQLFDFLGSKHLLLILDTFEQLVPWSALLEHIHSYAPGIKLLVTSRHRLELQGEWVMEVKGLNYPESPSEIARLISGDAFQTYSALELFHQAARRNQVTFQTNPEDLPATIHIARMLEGLPLGLELAATWINTISCQEIAAEINQGLDILESALGNVSVRQRSIRAVFDHSWKLLSSREQRILPRLAVFRGRFSRQAAEQVAGVTLRDLSALVDKSLVRRTADGRYDQHDLLRQYSIEILEQRSTDSLETYYRHCSFYTGRLADWNVQLGGINQGRVLCDMEMDWENCQAAWDWAICYRQLDLLDQAIDGLGMFLMRRALLDEGWETYRKTNVALQDKTMIGESLQLVRLSAKSLIWQAVFCLNLVRGEEAHQLLQKAQQVLDNSQFDPGQLVHERIFWLVILAWSANLQHNPNASVNYYQQAFELSRNAKVNPPIFFVFHWRFLMSGSVSKELYIMIEKNFEDVKQAGNPFELGCVLFVLGMAELFHTFRIEKAEPLLKESIKNFQLVDDCSTQDMILKTLGYLLLVQGKFAECYTVKQRELLVVQDIGDPLQIGIVNAEIGEVLYHQGKYMEAEVEIRKGMELIKDQNESEYIFRLWYLGNVLLAQGKFEQARQAYKTSYRFFQSLDEKGWMFTSLTGLSRTDFALGDRSSAWLHARQAIQLYSEIQLFSFFAYLTLANIALLLVDRGEIQKGLEIYYFTTHQGYLAQSRWFADLFGKFFEDATARLPVEEQDIVKKNGLGMDFLETMEILHHQLS